MTTTSLNRPSLLANLDRVLAYLRRNSGAMRAGQTGLFDSQPELLDPIAYDLVADWDEDTRLWHEREVLGAFVSGHPVPARRARQETRFTHRCRDRHAIETRCGPMDRIVVAGLVRRYERRARIAFIDIEDETGALSLISFNDENERFAHCLMANAILAVQIKVRHEMDRTSLQLTNCYRLGHFRPKD